MATQMTDIELDENEDLSISNGDFATVESTGQHQRQLILNGKGDFKQNPTVCVGITDYMDDEGMRNVVRAISIEFARDGMDVKYIEVTANGSIKSDAYYV